MNCRVKKNDKIKLFTVLSVNCLLSIVFKLIYTWLKLQQTLFFNHQSLDLSLTHPLPGPDERCWITLG